MKPKLMAAKGYIIKKKKNGNSFKDLQLKPQCESESDRY